MKIFAIGAHPDDIEIGCAGSLLKYAASGHDVYLFVMTPGQMGGEAETRKKEQARSAEIMKVRGLFWGKYKDTQLETHLNDMISDIEAIIKKIRPDFVSTPPYPEVLEKSEGYTGFAAIYGDNITITEPGNVWDRALTAYCRGTRSRPVWGISTADYHEEGRAGEKLGNFPTVFLLQEKSRKGVMEALKNGKMYAYRGGYPQFVRLDEFSVCSPDGENEGISGDNPISSCQEKNKNSIKSSYYNTL